MATPTMTPHREITSGLKFPEGPIAMPDGSVMHAEIQIGDSMIMLADEFPEMGARGPQTLGGTSVGICLYVPNVDALFNRAIAAGDVVHIRPGQ